MYISDFLKILLKKYSELCLLIFGCMGRGRGGEKTQSVTSNMLSEEVFDKAIFNLIFVQITMNNDEIDIKQPKKSIGKSMLAFGFQKSKEKSNQNKSLETFVKCL